MKTSTRNRLIAILATVAALAVGSFFAVSASSHKSVLTVQSRKNVAATVSSSTQLSSPVSTPVQTAVSTPVVSTTPAIKPLAVSASTPKIVKTAHRVIRVTVPKGSTIATRTATGIQTVSVDTSKVTVSVSPVVSSGASSGNPILFPADARSLIVAAPDWNGFVAPKASFAGVLSCKKSTVLMQDWFTGKWEYPYLVTERWKLTGGNFLIGDDPTHYTEADTYYTTFPNEESFTDNMNTQASSNQDFYFNPFNYVVGSTWADGTADTQRIVNYHVTSTYTQSECQ